MKSFKEIRLILQEFKPDIVHMHNFFPLVSPAAYYACSWAGVPVIQTLHDYRRSRPGPHLLRDGQICEECVPNSLWPSIRYGCYRQSRLLTLSTALMVSVHRWLETWENRVDLYIAVSEFVRVSLSRPASQRSKWWYGPIVSRWTPALEEGPRGYALFIGIDSRQRLRDAVRGLEKDFFAFEDYRRGPSVFLG